MLDKITPVILTFNEEPNIGRALEPLKWARDIVVVDSFSTDATLDIVRRTPQARVFKREFDRHAKQWSFAVFETGVESDWVLALDADYILSANVIDELSQLDPDAPFDAYRAAFRYCVLGKSLRGTLYPPVAVLFRRAKGTYVQDGHTHRLQVAGAVAELANPILHDDRKSLTHWLAAQDRYMLLEAEKISTKRWSELNWADRLRRFPPLSALAVFIYCYVVKGGALDGTAGLYYALQRVLVEVLLGLRLIDRAR